METSVKVILEQYERAKLLEIYFARVNGRGPSHETAECRDLYAIDLRDMKMFLLGQGSDKNVIRLLN
jgi:hypothetical protein